MDESVVNALEVVAERGSRLRTEWRFDWPESLQHAVCRLRLEPLIDELPQLVGIVGGASSGKSTVFDNLLGGHLTSSITARGHATLGPIAAIHENHRAFVTRCLQEGRMLPGLTQRPIELDDNVTGAPGELALVFHTVDALRDVLLFDLPDFTSEGARLEGDVTLNLLPWFDRILVVIDHERWFDRQSVSQLRAKSVAFGQQRWALLNRTQEGTLSSEDRAVLTQQAQRLAADGVNVLEFRRGRGLRLFAPGTLDDASAFIRQPRPHRADALTRQAALGARRVSNLNEERRVRLDGLRNALQSAVTRATPSHNDTMIALMTPSERKQLEIVSRVLRLHQLRAWVTGQTDRLQSAIKQVPLVGALLGHSARTTEPSPPADLDRRGLAESCFEGMGRRQVNEINRMSTSSAFWEEIGRWTRLEPTPLEFAWDAETRNAVGQASRRFDDALNAWIAKVERESKGVRPHVKGAVGFSAVGLALVLIAAPGPVAALTLVTAKGAVGAALSQLAVAAGAGAALGKPMGRLMAVTREKLFGSPEFDAVQESVKALHKLMVSYGTRLVARTMAECEALVLSPSEPLLSALDELRRLAEDPQ